ncbi:alpha/beta hydrolase [Rhodococcus sp. IEGM 1354]|uniref:alpha/beta hydrolase n=1 Tax=Rhodococcus sp. IEGM 1354 TaxID=3047088 RepID=UPI0024B7F671|nr:alpha/beta hydrolase [Rhodococcus sp. IEGM 1354]MDI9933219.1 alpha/beta hydrolase [Rhodococcus sp. IEGM 1354]
MSEQQKQAIFDLLRSGPNPATLSVADLRSMVDQGGAVTKPPGDVVMESVTIGNVPAEWSVTPAADPAGVILYFHGGGFIFGSLTSHRGLVTQFGAQAGVRTLAIDYRLAPENRFPSPLEDALAAYRFLLEQGVDAERIVLAGDSAGGGLVIATLVALRDAGTPLPGAAVCMSPWVDMSLAGESMSTKADLDPLVSSAVLTWGMDEFIDAGDRNDPRASPLLADLSGLPPVLIQVSSHEVLLDDATRLATRLGAADVAVQLQVWPQMPHVWQLYADILDEGADALRHAASFVREHIG